MAAGARLRPLARAGPRSQRRLDRRAADVLRGCGHVRLRTGLGRAGRGRPPLGTHHVAGMGPGLHDQGSAGPAAAARDDRDAGFPRPPRARPAVRPDRTRDLRGRGFHVVCDPHRAGPEPPRLLRGLRGLRPRIHLDARPQRRVVRAVRDLRADVPARSDALVDTRARRRRGAAQGVVDLPREAAARGTATCGCSRGGSCCRSRSSASPSRDCSCTCCRCSCRCR